MNKLFGSEESSMGGVMGYNHRNDSCAFKSLQKARICDTHQNEQETNSKQINVIRLSPPTLIYRILFCRFV